MALNTPTKTLYILTISIVVVVVDDDGGGGVVVFVQLLLLEDQNITTQKHSRTQRLHTINILYNYSMTTSCCKVSERKSTKSICIWTVGWVV
jgi:hypothetical protein